MSYFYQHLHAGPNSVHFLSPKLPHGDKRFTVSSEFRGYDGGSLSDMDDAPAPLAQIRDIRYEIAPPSPDGGQRITFTTEQTEGYGSDRTSVTYKRVERSRHGRLDCVDAPAVEIYRCGKDGRSPRLLREEWYRDGKLHRDGDEPAAVTYETPGDSYVITKLWAQHGFPHRDGDKPAFTSSSEDHRRTITYSLEIYAVRGRVHRAGGLPAAIERSAPSGEGSLTQAWFVHGRFHRDGDKPALVEGLEGSRSRLVKHYKLGVLTRDPAQGPAVESGHDYSYYVDGKLCRFDGPAKWTAHGRGNFRTVKAEFAFGSVFNNGKLYTITDLRSEARKEFPDLRRAAAYAMFEMKYGIAQGLLSAEIGHQGKMRFPNSKTKDGSDE